ncbi:MAG: signal recognition particle-docking protein FtsY [Candidatus Methanospirareceae archaeon]
MFEGLKKRIKKFTEAVERKIAEKIREKEEEGEGTEIKAEKEIKERIEEEKVERQVEGRERIEEGKEIVEKVKGGVVERAKAKLKRVGAIIGQEVEIDEKDLEKPLEEFEIALLESDVALPVAEELISSVKRELVGKKRRRREKIGEIVEEAIRKALMEVLSVDTFDFKEFIESREKPVKIIFVGVNGTGKTTSIAKVAKKLMDMNYSVVIASADTYRAGATEQIELHAKALGVKVIKHQYGADPAAVVYDAIAYAKAHKKDVVLADTAGRMHTSVNLMEQLKKICRVTNPDLVIFVDEAIAGNDAVERAKRFNEMVGIDASMLTKVDVDAKGGAAISIAYITKKPILFIGTGQGYDDIREFDAAWLVDRLLEA